jgi:hypothetical protein
MATIAGGRNYMANHVVAPQIIQGTPNYNVEVAEGQVPPGEFYPAGYLPVTQSENRIAGSGFVLMPGKVVCLDANGRLVPAGLAAEVKKARGVSGYGTVGTATTYDKLCVENQVINARGNFVVDTDNFVTSNLFSTTNSAFNFTQPVGVMRYSALKSPGYDVINPASWDTQQLADPSNPATWVQHSYNTGGARAFSRWCYIQVPVVETQSRSENIPSAAKDYRILLYPNGSLSFSGGNGFNPSLKALPQMMTSSAATGGIADQYCMVGRTLLFNGITPSGVSVSYTPIVKTPFCSLVQGVTSVPQLLIGQAVTYDVNSNFVLKSSAASAQLAQHLVGQILDVKAGQNDDLKLVRSYYRDFGLWQEQPGSATDGRNTQLSIVNAPKYIARIAVNFETIYTQNSGL